MVGVLAMDSITVRVGAKLRALRRARKETQKAVAQTVGCAKNTYGDVERGKYLPRPTVLEAIAKYYGMTVDELLRDEKLTSEDFERQRRLQVIMTTSEHLSTLALHEVAHWLVSMRGLLDDAYERGRQSHLQPVKQHSSIPPS